MSGLPCPGSPHLLSACTTLMPSILFLRWSYSPDSCTNMLARPPRRQVHSSRWAWSGAEQDSRKGAPSSAVPVLVTASLAEAGGGAGAGLASSARTTISTTGSGPSPATAAAAARVSASAACSMATLLLCSGSGTLKRVYISFGNRDTAEDS